MKQNTVLDNSKKALMAFNRQKKKYSLHLWYTFWVEKNTIQTQLENILKTKYI